MFCRNCGRELAEDTEICMSCGVKPSKGNKFCPTCGAETAPEAEICVKCGTRLVGARPVVAAAGPTSKPIWAGVLSIIAGAIAAILGIFAVVLEPLGWAAGVFGFGFLVGIPWIIMGAVAIVGGAYALRRRIWGLALAGTICSFFCIWPLGIPAIVLTALSKGEFS